MSGAAQTTLKIIVYIEIIIGCTGSGFISLVNFVLWVKRRKISLFDQVLTALATCRNVLFCSLLIPLLIPLHFSDLLPIRNTVQISKVIWIISNHFNLWLSTILSIFYFLKIATFSHSIFLYLKWRLKKVSRTLLMSLFFLFLNIILSNICSDAWYDGSIINIPHTSKWRNFTQLYKSLILTNSMFILMPFVVSLTSFLLLIFSLWKHLKRMQLNAPGSRDTSTMAHMKALRTGVAFLLLYVIVLFSVSVQALSLELVDDNLIIFWDQANLIAFPSGHSFVLILGNRKLKQASVLVWGWLRCKFRETEPKDP
ncbi:taste receptor type 2 member 140-like [Fukomys damarensis]|uniref:taste receptor type 2 member 140-like n=1 Tax=Fukomys damarensis TaxID=885580 RepID=UPI00053FAAE0|nr:taste receptor type 2 member 140-like [Fukomys damarensis]